ncbi:MAG: DUF268 domain-containing protein [Patescibacteria group bacterium]
MNKVPGILGLYQFLRGFTLLPGFYRDYRAFKKAQDRGEARFPLRKRDFFLALFDKTGHTPFDPHYIYHPAWAARVIAESKPAKHVDIASILSFSTVVSAFVPTDFYDYRPAQVTLPDFSGKRGDLLALPFEDKSIASLSCMHTVEHVGLGRYGDPIDPDGDLKAMAELARVLAIGGNLLFVVPVGAARIEFNAHRVYSYEQVISGFSGLRLKEFALIPDNYKKHGLIRGADPAMVASQRYACGCFLFTKD